MVIIFVVFFKYELDKEIELLKYVIEIQGELLYLNVNFNFYFNFYY